MFEQEAKQLMQKLSPMHWVQYGFYLSNVGSQLFGLIKKYSNRVAPEEVQKVAKKFADGVRTTLGDGKQLQQLEVLRDAKQLEIIKLKSQSGIGITVEEEKELKELEESTRIPNRLKERIEDRVKVLGEKNTPMEAYKATIDSLEKEKGSIEETLGSFKHLKENVLPEYEKLEDLENAKAFVAKVKSGQAQWDPEAMEKSIERITAKGVGGLEAKKMQDELAELDELSQPEKIIITEHTPNSTQRETIELDDNVTLYRDSDLPNQNAGAHSAEVAEGMKQEDAHVGSRVDEVTVGNEDFVIDKDLTTNKHYELKHHLEQKNIPDAVQQDVLKDYDKLLAERGEFAKALEGVKKNAGLPAAQRSPIRRDRLAAVRRIGMAEERFKDRLVGLGLDSKIVAGFSAIKRGVQGAGAMGRGTPGVGGKGNG